MVTVVVDVLCVCSCLCVHVCVFMFVCTRAERTSNTREDRTREKIEYVEKKQRRYSTYALAKSHTLLVEPITL